MGLWPFWRGDAAASQASETATFEIPAPSFSASSLHASVACPPAPDADKRPPRFDMEYCLISEYMRHPIAENVWYYRDRMSTPRGPCTLPVLREAWVNGVIDGKTLVWGQGLADWLPARNVTNLVWQVETLEVRLATWIKRKLALDPARRRKEARDLASGRSVPVRFDPELVSALLPRLAEHLTDAEADRLMAVVGQTAVDQAAKDAADSEGCERDKALLRKRIKEWEKLRSKAKGRKTAAGAKQG